MYHIENMPSCTNVTLSKGIGILKLETPTLEHANYNSGQIAVCQSELLRNKFRLFKWNVYVLHWTTRIITVIMYIPN